ncbi:ABC transporter ATP-binding protein [Marinivivus vitaminiproducens]|uniref:ABC transporter ATP-binding protein n=1 Tax=Marinivivus vitaminiproducens TaxID=3035935 RepID=UPI0027AB5863|nr:ABC transporter ATP-binding protein [Geminicoccaceae bacterium SCSIO 64248]
MSRLVIERLQKSFGSFTLFEELDLAVEAGETVAIAGPSGGGKTMFLRLIAGLIEPSGGDIRIDGASVLGTGPEGRDVGMAFQNFALYPHFPAFENIASPLRATGADEATIRKRVDEVASLLKIDHVLHHTPKELSNGQKQRTALARALVRRPKVLLLDDPLRNVDAKLRFEMRLELPRLLRESGSAVLYVTQDYREAMGLGDRVGILRAGRFEQVAPPAEIYREPRTVEIARLFGDPTINLFQGTPRGDDQGLSVDVLGRSVRLDPSLRHAAGRACLIGIRPEHVEIGTGSGEFELDAVMPLNVRAVLLLRAPDGSEILATCPEERAEGLGRGHRQVSATIKGDHAILFDAESGSRIAPQAA